MKRQIKWIEVSRTLAMASIVCYHVVEQCFLSVGGKAPFGIVALAFVYFTVPLFFIISGYLVRIKYESGTTHISYASVLKGKYNSLIRPFLVWNILYMIIFRLCCNWPIACWNTPFLLATGYMHLYFVFVLLQFFLLYPLLHPYLKGKLLLPALVFSALLSFSFYSVSEYFLWTRGSDNHFFEWHYGKVFVGWSLFLMWGVWLGHKRGIVEKIARHTWILGLASLISFVFYFWETSYEVTEMGDISRNYFLASGLVFQFVCANFAIGLMYKLDHSAIKSRFLDYAASNGRDVFGIYLSHVAFIVILLAVWKAIGLPNEAIVKILVLAPVVWASSHSLVKLCRLPRLSLLNKYLFGGRG